MPVWSTEEGDGVGLLSRKPFSTIKARSSSLSRHLPKVSPPPQARPPQMAAKTWWSPPVSCDFNSSNPEWHITYIQISKESILRLDFKIRKISSFFVKWPPSSGVVDDGVVRLEQLDCGEATHLFTQHQHVVSFLRHDVHLHKLYRDSGELVGGHIDLGDDDGVVVLEVLAQLVPDGSQLLAMATPGQRIFERWWWIAPIQIFCIFWDYLRNGDASH